MTQETSIDVVNTGRRLPPFWDREIVFFANLLALFFGNEKETSELADEVGEVDSYGARLIPIVNLMFQGQRNLLVLEREPAQALCGYFQNELGLRLPELAIMPHRDYQALAAHFRAGQREAIDQILTCTRGHPADWIHGYVTDHVLESIASHVGKRTIASREGSHLGNNKYLLHQYLEEAGLPTVETETAESAAEIPRCVEALRQKGYRDAVLKSQIGASGIGLMKLPEIDAANWTCPEVPEHMFFEGPCMVQGWLRPGVKGVTRMRSPSVQLFVQEEAIYLYDITEQILGGDSVHEGNESPPPYLDQYPGVEEELYRQAGESARWLYRQGYRGTGSVDFLLVEYEDRPTPEVYVCEINARVTGATLSVDPGPAFSSGGRVADAQSPIAGTDRGCAVAGDVAGAGSSLSTKSIDGDSAGQFQLWDGRSGAQGPVPLPGRHAAGLSHLSPTGEERFAGGTGLRSRLTPCLIKKRKGSRSGWFS